MGDAGPLSAGLARPELDAAAMSRAIWLAAAELDRDTGADEGCKVKDVKPFLHLLIIIIINITGRQSGCVVHPQ